MDKILLEQYNNKESMGKMMLKQEEVFKEQVKELHRLYRVQKMLMTELRSKEMKFHYLSNMDPRATCTGSNYTDPDQQTEFWSPNGSQTSHSYFSNNYHQTVQIPFDYNFHQRYNVRLDSSSQEPSSSSGETFRMHRGFDLEWPARGDTSTNVSEIHDQGPIFRQRMKDKMAIGGISHDQCYNTSGENDVELTLSIGYGTDKKKSKHRPRSNIELGCSESTPNETRQPILSTSARSEREEECGDRESLQRQHWLFRTLSLNRT
ncbi:uncharacterized protein LOC131256710 isoform X2 [Magnolia sinica]|uniref:uncharacterized protein LOC131256710 isoform X2 n=1 Tax=Magnolia sinica TaxID=86752 RepID=UPI002658A32B|nr:uncharacterized protein LOC131256710 isoform X2 [Magnolia sinica]